MNEEMIIVMILFIIVSNDYANRMRVYNELKMAVHHVKYIRIM